jgi:tetratricopeptide (TPR) repeat protein
MHQNRLSQKPKFILPFLVLLITLLIVALLPSKVTNAQAQEDCDVPDESAIKSCKADACIQKALNLELNITQHQELATGQLSCFKVEATKQGQYIQILIKQNGIDVVTTLCDPAGNLLVQRDTTTGASGVEPISFIAEKRGVYTLVVEAPGTPIQAPPEANSTPNSFDITFKQSRMATALDRLSVRAEWEFHPADVLRGSNDKDKLSCAVIKFQKALDSYIRLKDINAEAQTRNNLAYTLNILHRYKEAIAYVRPAIDMWPFLKNPFQEGEALNNLGFAYEMEGEIDGAAEADEKALDKFKKARAITKDEEILSRIYTAEINTLINLSDLYIKINRPDKAILTLSAYIDLPFVANNPRLAILIRDIGRALASKGDYKKALDQFNSALAKLPKEVADLAVLRASILNSKGVMHIYLGEDLKGLASIKEALDIIGNSIYGRAAVYNSLGGAYGSKDDKGKRIAHDYYWKALDLLDGIEKADRTFQVAQGTADTLYNLAIVQRDLGQLDEAKASIEEAIAYLEFLRTRTSQQENREAIFAGKHFYYDFYADQE